MAPDHHHLLRLFFFRPYYLYWGLLLFVLIFLHAGSAGSSTVLAQTDAPQQLSDTHMNSLLQDLRRNGFFSAATLLTYIARPFITTRLTLLIPSDSAIAQALNFAPSRYPSLIQYHIIDKSNLLFSQLRLLPVNTWLPTALPGYGVQVTSNSPSNYSLNDAMIVRPDLCSSVQALVTCQGISRVLVFSPQVGMQPSNPPVVGAPSTAPAPALSPFSKPSPAPILPILPLAPRSSPAFSSSPPTTPPIIPSAPVSPPLPFSPPQPQLPTTPPSLNVSTITPIPGVFTNQLPPTSPSDSGALIAGKIRAAAVATASFVAVFLLLVLQAI